MGRAAIDDPATLASVALMEAYALSCETPGACSTWRELAFARQVSICLGYGKLKAWTRSTAKNRRNQIQSEKDEAYYRLLAWVDPEQGMALPGLVGHYIAAQMAEDALLTDDKGKMEIACHRLADLPHERYEPASAFLEHVLYDSLCGEHHHRGFSPDRLRSAMLDVAPVYRQKLGLDLARLRGGVVYGSRRDML